MDTSLVSARVFRFGIFELDAASGELRKRGIKVRLSDQPLQILRILLSRPGQLVTRQDLRQELWGKDTFVDFDVALNSAVRKLRDALGDSADNPRFIETVPRRGYRLIIPVQAIALDESNVSSGTQSTSLSRPRRAWIVAGLALAATIVGTLLIAYERKAHVDATSSSPSSKPASIPAGVKPEAYDAYLKGVLAGGQQTTEGFKTAVQYYEQAVALQPDFAVAHAAMAKAQVQLLYTGPLAPRDVVPKAEAAARTALKLDETLSEAHTTLGTILQQFYWQWNEGEKEFRRALALGNSGGNAIVLSMIRRGRWDEAVGEGERLVAQDPQSFNAHTSLGTALRAGGQYDRALSEFHRARDIMPQRPLPHFQLGVTLLAMGRLAEAITELQASTEWHNPRMEAYLGYAYAVAQRRDDARTILGNLKSRGQQEYVSSFGIALLHDALNEKAEALAALERASEERAVEFAQMPQYPPFKHIANEPRYHAVMRRVELEQ
jgi:DNA-binding winged helix-turn-helix (wHTH) protein/tetratricopeptide (TPR) repeat protein